MWRALQLARNGEGRVSPNPMVGAVIVHDGRIIGEGFHSFFGGPHAEVNAINSVDEKDKCLLSASTIYVTLEPCAHHGKTPPCASLIVSKKIPRVVIGSPDPNPLVAGKGIKILREAGVEVVTDVLRKECDCLNRKFLYAQTSSLPWISLKWAQSADQFIAGFDNEGKLIPVKFSSPLTSVWMHRYRSLFDAILIGANTEKIDSPALNVRFWGGDSPRKFVAHRNKPLDLLLKEMRNEGISSLLVEGGASLLSSMIEARLFNEIRIETSFKKIYNGLKAPCLPEFVNLEESVTIDNNIIQTWRPKDPSSFLE